MATYSGTLIQDLQTTVERRLSSVDKRDGFDITVNARLHLCDRVMDAGDVQAWWLMADLQDELLLSTHCVAELSRHSEDVYAEVCRRPTVAGSSFCSEHLQEFES